MASEEAKLHGRIAELQQRLADREAELASIRKHLGGHPDSQLDGPNGLAEATYSAVQIERERADRAEEVAERMSRELADLRAALAGMARNLEGMLR
jgi:chromosome segregation ATPase